MYIFVRSHCLTWNAAHHDVELSRCLYIHQDKTLCDDYNFYGTLSDTVGLEMNTYYTNKPYIKTDNQNSNVRLVL